MHSDFGFDVFQGDHILFQGNVFYDVKYFGNIKNFRSGTHDLTFRNNAFCQSSGWAGIIWDKNSGGTLSGIVWRDNVFYETKGRAITWNGDYHKSIWDEYDNVYWHSRRPTQPTTGSSGSSVEMDPKFAELPKNFAITAPALAGKGAKWPPGPDPRRTAAIFLSASSFLIFLSPSFCQLGPSPGCSVGIRHPDGGLARKWSFCYLEPSRCRQPPAIPSRHHFERTTMLKTTLSCLIVLGTSLALAAEQQHASAPTVKIPTIEMRLIETDEGTLAEVLSDAKLVNPRIEYICGEWACCYEPIAENGKFLYRANRYYTPTPNTLFSVASDAPDKAQQFKASYAFRHGGKDRKEPVLLETVTPNALVAVESDPAGPDPVLRVINRWRARFQSAAGCL